MGWLRCQSCGDSFHQARGRPAKRCGRCRASDRYGATHRAIRAETAPQAVGKACVRCHEIMLPGQEVQLDHADDGSGRYLGYSHKRCNLSAGASRGNAMRAAAYRAMKAGVLPAELNGSRSSVVTDDPPDGTIRDLPGGGVERWSATYRQWVRASRRW